MECTKPICRAGFPSRRLLVLLPIVVALPAITGMFLTSSDRSSSESEPLACSVKRGEFVHEITTRGEVESAVNVEVCCEVSSSTGTWTRILEVVPEGTYAQPGDFLIQLDSSALENDRTERQLLCNQAEAALVEARNAYETALAAKREYLHGEFALEQQDTEISVFQAEERVRTARQSLDYSRHLAAKGYFTEHHLEAEEFTLKSAENKLRSASIARDVLWNLTRQKQLKDLESDVVVGKARLESRENILELHLEKLAEIEEQIAKCTIRAPVAGPVVLAHLHHHGHSHMIEPGELAHLDRALIRLPDPAHMQVKAKVKEADIALVEEGMPVRISLEAFPEVELEGEVQKVKSYPEPQSWFGPNIHEYETIVAIKPSSVPLRPGLTAELKILVNRLDDQLLLPCQAVFQHGDRHYCLLFDGGRWEAHELEVGPDNGKFVVILGGIEEGRKVVLDSATHRDKVELPELPAESAGSTAKPAVRP